MERPAGSWQAPCRCKGAQCGCTPWQLATLGCLPAWRLFCFLLACRLRTCWPSLPPTRRSTVSLGDCVCVARQFVGWHCAQQRLVVHACACHWLLCCWLSRPSLHSGNSACQDYEPAAAAPQPNAAARSRSRPARRQEAPGVFLLQLRAQHLCLRGHLRIPQQLVRAPLSCGVVGTLVWALPRCAVSAMPACHAGMLSRYSRASPSTLPPSASPAGPARSACVQVWLRCGCGGPRERDQAGHQAGVRGGFDPILLMAGHHHLPNQTSSWSASAQQWACLFQRETLGLQEEPSVGAAGLPPCLA